MKRFLLVLQALLISFMMSAQINMSVIGRAELDPEDNDARAYYNVKDANDKDCAIIKVSLNNPVNNTLVLNTRGGLATVKFEKRQDGEWWFWVSPDVTNIMFSCEGYTPTDYLGVALKPKSVYRLNLNVDASVSMVRTFTLGESVMKLNITPDDVTVSYGKTPKCDMGTKTLKDGLFEEFLDRGVYYYKIENSFYETYTGKYTLTEDAPEVSVSLTPSFNILSLDSNPQGAEVYVNNRLIGTTPIAESYKIRKAKGVEIEFRKDEYYVEQIKVDIPGDGKLQVIPTVNLRPQFGYVTCVCDDPGAELILSDASREIARGRSGMRVKLASGRSYKLESSKASHISQAQGIKGSSIEGKDVQIKVDAPVPIYGGLQISSTPSRAKVFIDGEEVGTTALSERLLIGSHRVELKLDGYHLDPFNVLIEEGKTARVAKELIKGPREVLVELATVSGSNIVVDGQEIYGNIKSVMMEVGRTYTLESKPANSTLAYNKSKITFTPTYEEGQKVQIPGPRILSGILKLTTGDVSGVQVRVSGKNTTRSLSSPATVSLPIGTYSVTAKKSGYKDASQENVEIREGKTTTVKLNMRKDIHLVSWYWSEEESKFASHFIDLSMAIPFYEGGSEPSFAIGAQYAYCNTHIGGYGQLLYDVNYETYAFSLGPVVRLTEDFNKVDWQVYAGAGWMYENIGFEIGTRLGWHSDPVSSLDFGMGLQVFNGQVAPTFQIGWIIPVSVLAGLLLVAMGGAY